MFNIGGDDKEKLEENMEEIKELVNEGNDEPEETDSEEMVEEKEKEFVENPEGFELPAPYRETKENMNETIEEGATQNDLNSLQSEVQQNAEEQSPEPLEEEPKKEQNQEKEAEESINTTQTRSSQSISDERGKDEVKKLKDEIEDHISSMEEGRSNGSIKEDFKERKEGKQHGREEKPLSFLDVKSFEDIREMVEEMHYLTTEMDDIMEHLVAGVEEDQETVKEAGQVIQEFQTRRNKIEETLKQN
jgi:hypothetical protein